MNKHIKKIAVGAMAVAVATVALPPSPAGATSSVNCTDGVVKVHHATSGGFGTAKCFGGSAGPLQVNIERTHRIETGRYRVQFFITGGGQGNRTITFGPWMSTNLSGNPTVYQIWIQ